MRKLVTIALPLALAACVSGGAVPTPRTGTAPPVTRAPTAPAPAPPPAFRSPLVQSEAGLESVIGSRAQALSERFGNPRIDLVEGDARKLQFLGTNCVLDVFLYPLKEGSQPVATHVEARSRSDASAIDRAACIREVSTSR